MKNKTKMVMPRKIRYKLCKKCQKVVLEEERKYKEINKKKITEYKKEHYKKQKKDGKIQTSRDNIINEGILEKLKKDINKIPNENI